MSIQVLIKAVEQRPTTGKLSRDRNVNALMDSEAIKEFENSPPDQGALKRTDLVAKWKVTGFKMRKRLVTEVLSSTAWESLQRGPRSKAAHKAI